MSIAVYAGSFDPPTLGHVDVIQRVLPLFEELHLVVAVNSEKKGLFLPEERVALLEEIFNDGGKIPGNLKIVATPGLIVNYCREVGAKVLIRGIRAVSDFEKEFQISCTNKILAPEIESLHIMTERRYSFVSSSLIKEVALHHDDLSEFVPKNVEKKLLEKIRS